MSFYFMSQSNLRYWIKFIYIYLLLLILMLWHRQAIFESKGDKLSSSAESRIRNIYISKFENSDFKIYKSPDMQSTNVKHDSYMAVICPENIW